MNHSVDTRLSERQYYQNVSITNKSRHSDTKGLAGVFVEHCLHLERPSINQLVVNKVGTPTFVLVLRTQMPLPSVSKHQASQCTARAKSTKYRCLNPAAYGCRTCRLHGAHKPNSIKRGKDHPNYRHGIETLERKRQRSIKLAELREIEDDLIQRGFIKCKRTVGRKSSRR